MEPTSVLAGSMVSMICIGMLSQYLQTTGGYAARLAPAVALVLIALVSLSVTLTLLPLLSSELDDAVPAAAGVDARH